MAEGPISLRAFARRRGVSLKAVQKAIASGRVTIGGRVATLGDRIDPAIDEVRVDGDRISVDPGLRYLALHKPKGVTTTIRDPHAERDLRSLLPQGPRVFPVGRLDRDTEGLLVLTNDGELAHRLAHPRHAVEKEYLAEVDGAPTARQLSRLKRGVELDDGVAHAADARDAGRSGERGAVRIVMTEGRKREVRRMLEAVGHPVRWLRRVRFGPVRLGELARGAWRDLTPAEVDALHAAAGGRLGDGTEP